MSPRRFQELDRRERHWAVARLVLRVTVAVVILLAGYYLLPGWRLAGGVALLKLLGSCLVFAVIVAWLARRVALAELPELRAIEVLAIVIPLFLYLFASLYLSLSHESAVAFSQSLSHTGALYFAITVFSTVGFGDITPRTDVARIVVGIQMLLDLVLLGAVVRLVVGAARSGLSRGPQPPSENG